MSYGSLLRALDILPRSIYTRLRDSRHADLLGLNERPVRTGGEGSASVRNFAVAYNREWLPERPAAAGSVDTVITPERHEVTAEVLAQRHDLRLEATTQLGHELFIGGARVTPNDAFLGRIARTAPQLAGCNRLYRRLHRS